MDRTELAEKRNKEIKLKKARKNKQHNLHVPPTRGGLDDVSPAVSVNNPIDIQAVPEDTYRARREDSWNDRLREAFQTQCADYLTREASEYYFSRGTGRQWFYHYLRMDVVIRLSQALRRKLTEGEMALLVAEDGEPNSVTCVLQFQVGCSEELKKINAERELHRKPPISRDKYRPSDDLIQRCRFTPVRWLHLPMDRHIQGRFYDKASEFDDVLRLLASTNTWMYFGSFYNRVDPKDPTKKKILPVSGAPWFFEARPGKYVPYPKSPLVMMFKMNPNKVEAHASVGADYINKLFREHLERLGREDTREEMAAAAEEIWQGDVLDMYDKVLGAA